MVIFWILLNVAVVTDAFGDALFKLQKWYLSKALQLLNILSFAGMIYCALIIYKNTNIDLSHPMAMFQIALSYLLIRVGIFNPAYELAFCKFKRESWWWYHLGTTDIWDKFMNWLLNDSWFARKFTPDEHHFLLWFYVITWVLSLGPVFYLIRI